MENELKAQRRKGAFVTSPASPLIEADGQLGYEVDGKFVPVYDLRGRRPDNKSRGRKSEKEMLEKFLAGSPHMREQAKAGLVTFSTSPGCIHFHTTVEGFKAKAPGSAAWWRANEVYLTPEQLAEEKKNPVRKLEGAELDVWAKTQFAESEREIAHVKQNGGRVPKSVARIEYAQPSV